MVKIKEFPLSIRMRLLIIISVLNILVVIPVGYMMYKALINYDRAHDTERHTFITNDLYQVKKNLSLERASTMAILLVPQSSFDLLNVRLMTARNEGKSALDKATLLFDKENSSEKPKEYTDVKDNYMAVAALRNQIDKALSLPSGQRDISLSNQFFEESTNLQDKINQLIEFNTQQISAFNPVVGRQARLTQLIWEISEYSAREYAILGKIIAQRTYPAADIQEKIMIWRHRVQYGLELANASIAHNEMNTGLLPYIKEAETHYFVMLQQIEDLFQNPKVGKNGVNYPITVDLWLELSAQTINSFYELTDAVLKINIEYINQIKFSAESAIILSLLLVMSAIAITFYSWWVITVRVMQPINNMVEALYKETQLQDHVPVMIDEKDEISKLDWVLKVSQKNAHQIQKERDNARASNIAKSEFLANMSHEIRTPMNVIVGIANILGRSSPLSEKQKEFVKTLNVSAESLLTLINDLLDFSKIETRNFELEKIPFNLGQLIEEVALVMSVKAREKNLKFIIKQENIGDHEFISDPTRLRQILMNLCGNAIKFTENGSVALTIRSIPSLNPGSETLSISVIDTGIGIEKDKIPVIFDKFTQADSTITRKYGGTGLGLAITKNFVEMMDGKIDVKSTPGAGTNFTVEFPILKVESKTGGIPQTDAINQERKKAGGRKILLVEDYYPNIVVTGTFLEQFGYNFDVAENGNIALQKFMENSYNIILMDVQMPGMDGYQVTQAIRKYETKNKQNPVYIIGLTAHATAQDRERCLESGMDDYMSKPFDPQKLEELLHSRDKTA
ncbi:MAG: ATP-binding protein [Alphaproteobacteria bacterium]